MTQFAISTMASQSCPTSAIVLIVKDIRLLDMLRSSGLGQRLSSLLLERQLGENTKGPVERMSHEAFVKSAARLSQRV